MRLNKLLAQMGVASRRKADELIAQGRISLDGVIVRQLGVQADPSTQEISVDGVPLESAKFKPAYYLLNKPRSVVTTLKDPEGRPTVREFGPKGIRLFPVGRLDYDAEGLLLLTNDGELANRLMHPRYQVGRTYLAKVDGKPSNPTIHKLRLGVRLQDGFVKPEVVRFDHGTKKHSWYRVVVREGRHHLIKRLWERAGHPVRKLMRTEFAGLKLADLKTGACRLLRPPEVQKLKALVGLKETVPPPARKRRK